MVYLIFSFFWEIIEKVLCQGYLFDDIKLSFVIILEKFIIFIIMKVKY